MSEVKVGNIRDCLRRLGPRQDRVTREELAAELSVNSDVDRRRLGDALKQMVRRGELTRYEDGSYRFVAEASPPASARDQWQRIYRAARVARGSFDAEHIGRITVVEPFKARRDLARLTKMGFLEEVKDERSLRYLGTALLRDTPEPPEPPLIDRNVKSGLNRAREAVAELNRLFLTMEIQSAGCRGLIRRQLDILNEEFGKGKSNVG